MKYTITIEVGEIERKNYHLFINLFIGDKPCRLLIDTGASKTVFDTERVLQFVKESKVKTHEVKSVGLGAEAMETKVATLKNIRLGKLAIDKWKVAVLPIGHVNQTYEHLNLPPIDGVLGSDFLMKHDAVISFKKRKIEFKNKRK